MQKNRIMSLNVNDFGGKVYHLQEYKYFNKNKNKNCINWKAWSRMVDKTETWSRLKKYIQDVNPNILVIEELLISYYENIDFISEFMKMGYFYFKESLPERGNFSLTMIFYRDIKPEYMDSPGNYRSNRSVVCKGKDLLICGSHFPPESDEKFLKYMEEFVVSNINSKFILIGDLNANDSNHGNKQMVERVIQKGMMDLWTDAGGAENTPTEAKYQGRLDYAIASPSLAEKVQNIKIDPSPMEDEITDHAAIIVDIIS